MSGLPIDPEWLWLIGGVVLLIAELIAPGFFLMFIGAAAIVTGFAALLLPIPMRAAVRAVRGACLRFRAVRRAARLFDAIRLFGRPAAQRSRRSACSARSWSRPRPIDPHSGRVRVGDSEWSARGGPAAPGDRVRIVDVEGNCLKVEPEHALPRRPSGFRGLPPRG